MDAPLFYFRNQKEGAGPCAARADFWGPSCKPPLNDSRTGGCLAGHCADHTAINVAAELDEVATWVPAGRPILVGYYATGHSHLGSPTATYVRQLPQLALLHPRVVGVMTFTFLAPCGPRAAESSCEGDGGYETWLLELCKKGCAIADAYGEVAAARALA